jgi:phosphoglucosamine mutase
VVSVAVEPDGRNINAGCGSTHIENLTAAATEAGAELGFAFDGDGDRVLAVDRSGAVHDGDELIALAAIDLRGRDALRGGVAVTVMTNYGFHQAMEQAGVEVATTQVGDRYVLEELQSREWGLGGEQSGHIISMDYAPTGDGIAAALLALRALDGRDLAEARPFEKLPQRLQNVEVADREAIQSASAVWEAVEREAAALEGRGRVLVRASGTEPLVRVMVEAPGDAECDQVCARLVGVVEAELA